MSFSNLNYHVVFSTKERRPFIRPDVLPRLSQYIGGIVKELGGIPVAVNGPGDHMHVVAILTPKIALAECIKTVKGSSSRWIHDTFADLGDFEWQDGYSAFSVSHSILPKVVEYVEGQQEHHRKMSFQEELIALLKRHGVQYDERHIPG
jgi:REP element-mobilizing transposase RayT